MNVLKNYKKVFNQKYFIATFLCVILIHGEILYNKLIWHDDLNKVFDTWNGGLTHGRWFHYEFVSLATRVAGWESVSFFNGLLTAFCIAAMTMMLFDLFGIRKKWERIPLILVFASIPSIATHFGYMVSAGLDFIGKLLCVLAAFLACKAIDITDKRIKAGHLALCVVLLACSIGEYQCYLAFYLSVVLFYFLYRTLHEKGEITWKAFVLEGLYYIATALAGLIVYLIVLKADLKLRGAELGSYQGINSFGITSPKEYMLRIVTAYRDFFFQDQRFSVFPFRFNGWQFGLFLIILILGLWVLFLFFKKNGAKVLMPMLQMALIPLALNFNFLLSAEDVVTTQHQYHYILLFMLGYMLLHVVMDYRKSTKTASAVLLIATFVFSLLYIRADNLYYTTQEVKQEQAISYFTELKTRIEMSENYDMGTPIAFVNEYDKLFLGDHIKTPFDDEFVLPFYVPILNNYNWGAFMYDFLGYGPMRVDAAPFEEMEEVQKMPRYPADGSIKRIDDTLVVKF